MDDLISKTEFQEFKTFIKGELCNKISRNSFDNFNREEMLDSLRWRVEILEKRMIESNSLIDNTMNNFYAHQSNYQELKQKVNYLFDFLQYKSIIINNEEFDDFINSRKVADVLIPLIK